MIFLTSVSFHTLGNKLILVKDVFMSKDTHCLRTLDGPPGATQSKGMFAYLMVFSCLVLQQVELAKVQSTWSLLVAEWDGEYQ